MIVGRIEVLSQLKNARFKKACSAGAVRREHRPASRPTGSPHPLSPCADDRWHWRRADFEQRSKSHRRSAPDVGPGRADPCAQSDAASAVTKARAMAQAGENPSGRTMPPHIPPLRSLTYCISTNYSTIPPIPPFSCGVVAYIYSSAAPVSEVSHFVLACRNSSDQAGSLLAPQSYGRHFARTRE